MGTGATGFGIYPEDAALILAEIGKFVGAKIAGVLRVYPKSCGTQ